MPQHDNDKRRFLPGLVLAVTTLLSAGMPAAAQEDTTASNDPVLSRIGALESQFDPKCYATASRLEDFMYGTPLSEEARFLKNQLLKRLLHTIWSEASASVDGPPNKAIPAKAIEKAMRKFVESADVVGGKVTLRFTREGNPEIVVPARDYRQYSSVAFSLRTILAIQQENLLAKKRLRALEAKAVDLLKRATDHIALAVLQEADRQARHGEMDRVSRDLMMTTWRSLIGENELSPGPSSGPKTVEEDQPLLRKIARQKIVSYAKYNQIANQLFVRNLQVYFARLSWPKDAGEAKAFRQMFTETVIAFSADLYREAAAQAAARKASIVGEADVASATKKFLPHRVNDYEDVVFFPALERNRQVTIEAYDFDAFRDSGIHWSYLGSALDDLKGKGLPDADPFAAELLAEQVAQFGVLILRMAGNEGTRQDQERLSAALMESGLMELQKLIAANNESAPRRDHAAPIQSAPETTIQTAGKTLFVEAGDKTGIKFMHRTSNWLSRLLRSYLHKNDKTGVITIPPAFGGSGVAAEDVNDDGHQDILLLSGSGNRLYLGDGQGSFRDATKASGLVFLRTNDRSPGEPRQPIIADFDNDGHQDVLITYVNDDHRLYRGNGDGTFVDVTDRANLGGAGLVGGPATTFDFDGDGNLDIYISYFGNYLRGILPTLKRKNDNGLPNQLFRNLGDMKFENVTEKAGVGDPGWGQAAFHTDFDGDHLQDLISGNDFGVNRYYRNKGDGTFEEVSEKIGTDKPSYTMSIAAADLNNDLVPDIYISNIVTMNKDEKYVLPGESTRMKFNLEKLAGMRVVEANDLFLSKPAAGSGGSTGYVKSNAVGRGYSATGWAWDADFFDADLDGDDDLYVLNGMNEFNLYSSQNSYFMETSKDAKKKTFIPVAVAERNVFFENEDGKLRKTEGASGLDFSGNSRSAVYLDWDGDGDLDICVNNFNQDARLFENTAGSQDNRWIKIKLIGDPSRGINRDAIGAQVILRTATGRTIWRQVSGTTGYMSAHPKEIHAGLGTSSKSVSAEVIWPNGRRQLLKALTPNLTYIIRARDLPEKEK